MAPWQNYYNQRGKIGNRFYLFVSETILTIKKKFTIKDSPNLPPTNTDLECGVSCAEHCLCLFELSIDEWQAEALVASLGAGCA